MYLYRKNQSLQLIVVENGAQSASFITHYFNFLNFLEERGPKSAKKIDALQKAKKVRMIIVLQMAPRENN